MRISSRRRVSASLRLSASLPACLAVLAIALLPAVSAGSADDPEVVDAAGDAGPASVPAPLGFEWADITALWFEEADVATVRLAVEVVRLDADPPGEVGAHFRIGDGWWIAGWTTILFPAPPFTYAGGFYCVADAAGTVPDASLCDSLDATHDGTRFTVALPRALFGLGPGTAIDEPRGYAVDAASAQPGLGQGWIEQTDVGRAFPLPGPATGGAADGPSAPADGSDDEDEADGGPGGSGADAGPGPAVELESADAPAAAWAFVGVALFGLAAWRRGR